MPERTAATDAQGTRLRPVRLACWVICLLFAACGGAGRLSADAPAGIDLSGTWRLDRAVSDDPEKLYEKFRAKMALKNAEQPEISVPRGDRRSRSGESGVSPMEDPNNPRSAEFQAAADKSHLNPYEMGVFGTMPRGDLITIKQGAQELYMFDGYVHRSFTPGAQSIVSVPEGVADQHSGWKSQNYVIDVKAQAGPETVERYHLSPDGKQLLAEIHSHGGNMPSMDIKRVYERASAAPSAAPHND